MTKRKRITPWDITSTRHEGNSPEPGIVLGDESTTATEIKEGAPVTPPADSAPTDHPLAVILAHSNAFVASGAKVMKVIGNQANAVVTLRRADEQAVRLVRLLAEAHGYRNVKVEVR